MSRAVLQNDTLGHRGRKPDPLYRIRTLLLAGLERLDEPGRGRVLSSCASTTPKDEVLGACLVKESVGDI